MSCTQLVIIILCACVMLLCMNYHGMYNFIIIIWCACIMLLSLPALHQEGEATTTCSCNTDCHNQPFVAANCNNVGQDDWYIMFGLLLKMRIYESCVYIYIYIYIYICIGIPMHSSSRSCSRICTTCEHMWSNINGRIVSIKGVFALLLAGSSWLKGVFALLPTPCCPGSFLFASRKRCFIGAFVCPGRPRAWRWQRFFYILLSRCFWCSCFLPIVI